MTLVGPDGAPKAAETGEVLFRDYGVSGIAVFNLSRFAEPGDLLLLDLLPQLEGRACESELRARYGRLGAPTGEELLAGVLLPAVARAALQAGGAARRVASRPRRRSRRSPARSRPFRSRCAAWATRGSAR